MIPTKERNHSGIFLSYKTHGFLFDCGEGIQRQFRIANIKPTKVDKIFISHWHGDHVFGLPGLLSTLSACAYERIVEIYGPKGTKNHMACLKNFFESKIAVQISVIEIDSGKCWEDENLFVEAFQLRHNVPSIGFRVVEKDRLRINVVKAKKFGVSEGPEMGKLQHGKDVVVDGKKVSYKDVTYVVSGIKIGYISDTSLCENVFKIAEGADLLICESTYDSSLEQKAEEYFHLTAFQAAMIASKSGAKRLVLTHFSQRYKEIKQILDDAKQAFDNVSCAHDFMSIKFS
jgi:ribonuclease Z